MKLLLCCCLLAVSLPAGPARLTFTKSFPGSVPAYVSVTVDGTGALQYKEAPDDPQPVTAVLSQSDTDALFSAAEKLNYFRTPIESGLKVANTGKKTFRYQDEQGKTSETVFNYSIIEGAQQLLDRFEQIASSERAYIDLDRTVHFDKLGVNDSLAVVESLWLRKQLSAPDQFIPLLNRIINHESYMHLVRDRAARLKDAFTGAPAPVDSSAPAPPHS